MEYYYLFYPLYVTSFFLASFLQIKKDIKKLSIEKVLSIWNVSKLTIAINLFLICPLFFYGLHTILRMKTNTPNWLVAVEFILHFNVNLFLYRKRNLRFLFL